MPCSPRHFSLARTPTHAITECLPIHPQLQRCGSCLEFSGSHLNYSLRPLVNGSQPQHDLNLDPKTLPHVHPFMLKCINCVCVIVYLCTSEHSSLPTPDLMHY